jgi:hypothetical protein
MTDTTESQFAITNRRLKVLAMVETIDRNVVKQGKCPYDQAGRIWIAARDWSDAIWLKIAQDAGYKRKKTPGPETRRLVREIYEARSKADLAPAGRRAS